MLKGWVHKIRKLKAITFIILRDRTGLVQCIVENAKIKDIDIKLEFVVSIIGSVRENDNKLK